MIDDVSCRDFSKKGWRYHRSPLVYEVLYGTVGNLSNKIYDKFDNWQNTPLKEYYSFVYRYGIILKQSWAGELKTILDLVAIGASMPGFREIMEGSEWAKQDNTGYSSFLKYLKSRGLKED